MTDNLEKAREWYNDLLAIGAPPLPHKDYLTEIAAFRRDAVVEGLRMAAGRADLRAHLSLSHELRALADEMEGK